MSMFYINPGDVVLVKSIRREHFNASKKHIGAATFKAPKNKYMVAVMLSVDVDQKEVTTEWIQNFFKPDDPISVVRQVGDDNE